MVLASEQQKLEDKPLNESSTCRFSDLYKEEFKQAKEDEQDPRNKLAILPRSRPLLLGSWGQMVQRYLLALQSRGAIVSRTIVVSQQKH